MSLVPGHLHTSQEHSSPNLSDKGPTEQQTDLFIFLAFYSTVNPYIPLRNLEKVPSTKRRCPQIQPVVTQEAPIYGVDIQLLRQK